MYYIEYTNIPTRYNNKQVIETNDLSLFVCLKDNLSKYDLNKLDLTNYAKRSLYIGSNGALISKIYKEDIKNNQVHVLYQYQTHFGETLKTILNVAPKEILV